MPRARWVALAASLSVLAAGCDIYDIGPALAALDAGDDSTLEPGDQCSDESVPTVESRADARTIVLDDLADDTRSLTGCDATGIDGPDGFVRLSAVAEQRWSILAEPLDPSADLVLYVMPTCDPGSCTALLDRCGAGIPESFVFQAAREGQYLLGIDTRAGAGTVSTTLLSTRCGDRKRELGEGCDDGNLMDGDGCDRECRLEISSDMHREIEPNNWPTEANVLPLTTDAPSVLAARLGGACDVDYFVLRIDETADVSVSMLDGAMLPCDDAVPSVTMTLISPDGVTRRGEGSTGGSGGACPSIEPGTAFAQDLEPGTYFLELAAERDAPTIDYNLSIEVLAGN
jgi:cysteine-rich repeat protein